MIRDMPNGEYHSHPSISSSDVKLVASKSLAHWKAKVYKDSSAFALGSAAHAMVLEPEKKLVIRGPEDRRGNKWKADKLAADLEGKILLTEGDYDLAEKIAEATISHPAVARYLADPSFVAEASFFATDEITGANIKCRPDGYLQSSGVVFDIKTTRDASPGGFPREIRSYNYDMQAAFYLRCMRAAGYDAKAFIFVAVEKEAPHAVCLHQLTEEYLLAADMRVTYALSDIVRAETFGDFTSGWPLINDVHLPRWQVDQAEVDVFDEQIDF